MTVLPTILAEGFGYLEAARWHDGALYFSDIRNRRIHRMDADGNHREVAVIAARPSGLGWTPAGTLLVIGMEDETLNCIAADGSIVASSPLSGAVIHPNDLAVDAHGRAYITQFGYDLFGHGPVARCGLLMIDTDDSQHLFGAGLTFPNGIALSADGRTMVVAESFAHQLTAFDVASDGSLSGQRVFAAFDDIPTEVPDGICMDSEGAVWVGMPMAGEFRRVLEGGEVTDRLCPAGPGTYCVDCVLGGKDLNKLYLLVADTSVERLGNAWDSTASVQAVSVPVPGFQ